MSQTSESVLELDQTEVEFEESARLPVRAKPGESVFRTPPPRPSIPGVIIGKLAGFEEAGTPLVTFPASAEGNSVPAKSTIGLAASQIGHEVALVFEDGDLTKPIILGCLLPQALVHREGTAQASADGTQLTLSAEREVVLRCGKSSITLTRAGKVIIRGAYLLSRSSGVNRIKGGSVQIN